MAVDRPRPLASPTDMDQSTLRDLITDLTQPEQQDLMVRATRSCEAYCGRRLAPFVGITESHRAEGVDPNELPGLASPGDLVGSLSASYSRALGSSGGQVRKIWVDQYAPLFSDLWSYTDVSITIFRSAGSSQVIQAENLLGGGIEPDTGECWFDVGTFLPIGSRVRVILSGGYHTSPRDLVEACCFMAAASLIDEDSFPGDGPGPNSHSNDEGTSSRSDSGFLRRAQQKLAPYRSRR